VTTGFEIMIDTNVNSGTTGPVGIPSLKAHNGDPFFGEGRHTFCCLEHEDLGRLSVGRLDMAGAWTSRKRSALRG
jgi:hypothetical protein